MPGGKVYCAKDVLLVALMAWRRRSRVLTMKGPASRACKGKKKRRG